MKLSELYGKYDTDKFDLGYVDNLYDDLFADRENVKKVLEIGIWHGGSLLLWRDWFPNAEIHGVDNNAGSCNILTGQQRIVTHCSNAYSQDFLQLLPNDFDIIIDDGPHDIESQKFFLANYPYKLKENGILVLEDIIHCPHSVVPSIPKEFEFELHQMAGKQKVQHLLDAWRSGLHIVVIRARSSNGRVPQAES